MSLDNYYFLHLILNTRPLRAEYFFIYFFYRRYPPEQILQFNQIAKLVLQSQTSCYTINTRELHMNNQNSK